MLPKCKISPRVQLHNLLWAQKLKTFIRNYPNLAITFPTIWRCTGNLFKISLKFKMAATNQLHNLLWPQKLKLCKKVVEFYNQILHDMEMCRWFFKHTGYYNFLAKLKRHNQAKMIVSPWYNKTDYSIVRYSFLNSILDRHSGIIDHFNEILDRHNGIVDRYNEILYRYNGIVGCYNGLIRRYNGFVGHYSVILDRHITKY